MLHAGTCPRCDQGLLGFRICCDGTRCLIVCDECEAVWPSPERLAEAAVPPLFATADMSRCPLCHQPLWRETARWATREDLAALNWIDSLHGEH